MHLGIAAYEKEMERHVTALRGWQQKTDDIGPDEAVVVEMHLLSCALYVRKMNEHKLVTHQNLDKEIAVGRGKTKKLRDICNVMIHSRKFTTDAASVRSCMTIKSGRRKPYEVPFDDVVKAFADYQHVQFPGPVS